MNTLVCILQYHFPKLERSIKPKLDEKIEKIVSKQENRSHNNVSLVIRVCNIPLRFFSP